MSRARYYGIPDVELDRPQGGTVNPSDFAGHDLVVLFCPSEPGAAARELSDYNGLSDVLAYNDAYMVAVCSVASCPPASRVTIAVDRQRAWDALGKCLDGCERPSPEEGGVLLFGRGGCLRKVWRGAGHSREVAEALAERM